MKYGQWCLAVSGASILLIGTAAAQSAANCRKGEFRGGAPVFYYDKACMAKLKSSNSSASSSSGGVVKKTVRKAKRKSSPKIKAVQKLLAAKGYKVGKPDGLMGPNTARAINRYYKKNGLKKGSGSKANAVLAHLKQKRKNRSAQSVKKAARVAAIKKAVAAKRAAAKKKSAQSAQKKSATSQSSGFDQAAANAAAAAKRKKARVAAIKKAVAAKRAAAKKKSAQSAKKDAVAAKAVSAKKAARVAAIKKAVAAKRAAAKKKSAQSAKKDAVAAKAVSAKKAARVAAIKKAVAAKRAAAKKKAVAPTAKASAPKAKSDAKVVDLQNLLKAKGLYKGKSDGTMNIDTRKSVINYYHENDVDIGSGSIVEGVHKHLKGGSSTAKKKVTAPKAKKAATTSSPKKTLGNKVVAIQEMLAKKGMYKGKADGILNSPTRKAILGYYKKAKVKRGGDTIINSVYNHLKSS